MSLQNQHLIAAENNSISFYVNFWQLKNLNKDMNLIILPKFTELNKHEFNFVKALKTQKTELNSFFKLTISKDYGLNFLQA